MPTPHEIGLEDLKKEVASIDWWHTIDLGHGIITPGQDDTPAKLRAIQMPEDLSGMTVLDIGAWDGFFAFEAERRGAKRVLAIDSVCWKNRPGAKDGFELARKVLRSRVEDLEMEVVDISRERIGAFDLVLFLGVLYHMRHPLLALERVSSVTKNLLILETAVDMSFSRRPAMVFYPGDELGGDSSNWWGPNRSAVEAMLRTVGFREVKLVAKRSPTRRFGAALRDAIKWKTPLAAGLQRTRMVFHGRP